MNAGASRKLPLWTEAFEEYVNGLPSPTIFKRWGAISALAGALERKVWVRTFGSNLYPNLYVTFVAPPGIGKSLVIAQTERLWRGLKEHHVAPTSLTKAALVDALHEATRKIIRPADNPPYVEFNSLLVLAGELGQFLPEYESEFMNALTGIYDGYPYAERRRGRDIKISIAAPQLNILGGTTPSYLNAVIPEGAWDQGFMSRMIMVYSGHQTKGDLFAERNMPQAKFEALAHDLEIIGKYYGKIEWDKEAADFMLAWYDGGNQPVPDHPKLLNYSARRTAHVLKLSMVAAVARSDFDYTIQKDDVEQAMVWLFEAEDNMPDIFRSMSSGGDSAAIEETWHMVFSTYAREKKPVSEARVIAHLRSRVPSHAVERIMMLMEKEGLLRPQLTSAGKLYLPAQKIKQF